MTESEAKIIIENYLSADERDQAICWNDRELRADLVEAILVQTQGCFDRITKFSEELKERKWYDT